MAGPTHKLFIDDSGNKEYSPDGRYVRRGGGRTPYFVFGGLLVTPAEAGFINRSMRDLKLRTFGDDDVEIKAHWLRRNAERNRRYLEPYSLEPEELTLFTEAIYDLLRGAVCKLVACVVDKAEVQHLYGDKAYYAPTIAYDCLLQRVQQEMMDCRGEVHVTVDAMTGATSAGNQHLYLLKRQHALLQSRGSTLLKGMSFDRVGGIAFRDSKLDERLQLADLVAYAVYRQFVDYGADWEDDSKPLELYDYLGRLAPKFRNRDGRIQGYGIVKFPMNRRVKWAV